MLLREPPLGLETRARQPIPNEVWAERPPIALQASVELWQRLRPAAVLRSITAVYNCVGMVVAGRRAAVDPEHLLRVLREDGCRRLDKPEDAWLGDVVVYRDPDGEVCHAGIIVERNVLVSGERRDSFKVLSKWGADGEYIHDTS